MTNIRSVLVRAKPYRCTHRLIRFPYWTHRAYELEIVGHGMTMAPRKRKVEEWALDWLDCNYETREWVVFIEWN